MQTAKQNFGENLQIQETLQNEENLRSDENPRSNLSNFLKAIFWQRTCRFLVMMVALLTCFAGSVPRSTAQSSTDALTFEKLKDLLANIGYTPNKLDDNWLQVVKESPTFTSKIRIGLSKDKTQVWFECRLTYIENTATIPASVWRKILAKNDEIGRATFSFSDQYKRIVLSMPLKNEGITAAQMRKEIDSFDQTLQKTYDLWDEKVILGKNGPKTELFPIPKKNPFEYKDLFKDPKKPIENPSTDPFKLFGNTGNAPVSLTGKWKVTAYQDQGQTFDIDSTKVFILEFTGNKMITRFNGDIKDESTYESRKSGENAQLDTTAKSGVVSLGIYKVTGKTLQICTSPAGSKIRPSEFKSNMDNKTILLTLEKVN